MSETNTWPGKPGVPLNPEKDKWHWLRTPDGELVPYNWRPAGECERGRWAFGWVYNMEDDWPPVECAYLGPCLMPDEATALQARVAELEARLRALLECPVIAVSRHHDPDSYCDETVFAETNARTTLEGKKDV